MTNTYPRLDIDLKAFRNNIGIIKNKYPNNRIILPVKANAYGHGDLVIAKEAEKIGIEYLAAARLCEGLKLRSNGVRLPIMLLGIESGENIKTALLNDIELSASDLDNLKSIELAARSFSKKVNIHIKLDTGMRRLGCLEENLSEIALFIRNSDHLNLKSFYTHLARSDDSIEFTNEQIKSFKNGLALLKSANLTPEFCHIYNSGGILGDFEKCDNWAIRPGISAYGYSPFDNEDSLGLIPVMTFITQIIEIKKIPANTGVSYNHAYTTSKDTLIATIAAGYGDGIPRKLSNNLTVNINNKPYKQIGTISMDLMVIEVDESVKIGDKVVIFGNKSVAPNDAKSLAKQIGTISYEITTGVSARVFRRAVE
ncbi:MAG TPA: alanine racemase [Spirochaetota bacterium]|nr:alanine racemase [Spirochaetota bacterium]HOS31587.1 alanine racemase [Spirochaetota bacterium]HOS54774.1 alanine racemase [Spirochaetota bacterium]HPK61911.1 alanine racemase [Spirochaetota bacterium]HQF77424.1 alanine racemase [Spirochaetota bacterium]